MSEEQHVTSQQERQTVGIRRWKELLCRRRNRTFQSHPLMPEVALQLAALAPQTDTIDNPVLFSFSP